MVPVESSFQELVRRTDGLQPWRRVFHALTGIGLALVFWVLPVPHRVMVLTLGILLAALLLLDAFRLANPAMNRLFFKTFSHLVSPREAGAVASSTWYLLGVLLVVVVFPRTEAMAGVLVLALADPFASYVGRRWGRRPLVRGTVEGSLTFLAVAILVLLFFAPWPVALASAALAAAVEALPWPVDDNLTIPLAVAGSLWFLG